MRVLSDLVIGKRDRLCTEITSEAALPTHMGEEEEEEEKEGIASCGCDNIVCRRVSERDTPRAGESRASGKREQRHAKCNAP